MRKFKRNWIYFVVFFVAVIITNSTDNLNGNKFTIAVNIGLWLILFMRLISFMWYLSEKDRIKTKKSLLPHNDIK